MKHTRFTVWAALSGLLVATVSASADSERSPAEGAPEQARQSFQRGVELYDEHDLNGAEVEFQRAYSLARNFRILYNLGQIAQERHDYAAAQDFYYRYLRDGGPQIAPDRVQTVENELAKLTTRVGRLNIVYDAPGAEVLIDNLSVGRTPLPAPVTVNLGRRRVDLKPRHGAPLVRFVDVPGGDTVTLPLASEEPEPVPPSHEELPAVQLQTPAPIPAENRSRSVGVAWTCTGVLAVGTVVAAVVAYRESRDLRGLRQSYPVTREELDSKQHSVRVAGWVTDGLLAGTAALSAVSLYLTFTRPAESQPASQVSVGWAWPGVLRLSGSY